MKNYYEILEVDIHASNEMVERAYKLLAKRYHPDTQQEDKKEWAEEEFKKINEAYEILSNKEKRESYTKELEFKKENTLNALCLAKESLEEQVVELKMELQLWKNNRSNMNNFTSNSHTNDNSGYTANTFSQEYSNSQQEYHSPNQSYYVKEEPIYYESYYHPVKSRLKSFLAFVLTILAIIGISFLIWQIPFVRNWLINLYENNNIIKLITDTFLNIF